MVLNPNKSQFLLVGNRLKFQQLERKMSTNINDTIIKGANSAKRVQKTLYLRLDLENG